MSYMRIGSFPDSAWKYVNGVAKPLEFATLGAAQELQRQINRWAKHFGLGTIKIDGDLGAGTRTKLKAAVQKIFAKGLASAGAYPVLGTINAIDTTSSQSISFVATKSVEITLALKKIADANSIGAYTAPADKPASPMPTDIVTASREDGTVNTNTSTTTNTSLYQSEGMQVAGIPVNAWTVGGAILVAALMLRMGKGKKGKKGKSAAKRKPGKRKPAKKRTVRPRRRRLNRRRR